MIKTKLFGLFYKIKNADSMEVALLRSWLKFRQ